VKRFEISLIFQNFETSLQVCEILEVVEGTKIYQLGSIRTNKLLATCVGGNPENKQRFRFEYVSNSNISEEEWKDFRAKCEQFNKVLPTLDEIGKKEKEIKEALDYQLKEEDVEAVRGFLFEFLEF
jgi:RNA polymerase-associated protein RTF1